MIFDISQKKSSLKQSYKVISILDENFFTIKRGKRITREEINKNKGDIPVYSSSKFDNSVLGYISYDYLQSKNLTLETESSILFNLDGSVGYCFIKKDRIYSFIDVVASLKPKTNTLLLEYLKIALEYEIKRVGANYSTKFYFNKLSEYDIKFKIPTLINGEFDIKTQEKIITKYNLIDELKSKVWEYEQNLKNLKINIDNVFDNIE